MTEFPKIENAPGIAWRRCALGWQARWRARGDLVERGFKPSHVQLWRSTLSQPEPSPAAIKFMQDQCEALQSAMLVWGRGGLPQAVMFDGTIRTLAECYRTDADSPYRKVRFKTRKFYDKLLGKLVKEEGDVELRDLKARTILGWHERWSDKGLKPTMGHSMIGMVRTLVNFGAVFLEDKDCERLSFVLHKMKFAQGKARSATLTAEMAIAIRKEAHRRGFPSIALAQALQFEFMLRQKDVIGEWVPTVEPGVSDITRGNDKWLRGLRWNEIDKDLILTHVTSKRQKEIKRSLRNAPMVMEELALMGELPTSGAVVICETTTLPWSDNEFRRWWRILANACGIPANVRNMDSRAGAITEATMAGANLEHVQHAATHGDISMTQRYARGDTEKADGVQLKRIEHRNKKAT